MGDISIKGRSPLLKGGRVGFKKGSGFKLPKGIKKVKRGYDQEFTLPKGTSAAAIKQSKVKKPLSKDLQDKVKAAEYNFANMGPHKTKAFVKWVKTPMTKKQLGNEKIRSRWNKKFRKAETEDAMREKLLGSLGPKGRISNKKGGKA